jgi:putative transposase
VVYANARGHGPRAPRWGKTNGKMGFHSGKVEIEPGLRSLERKEQALPSGEAAVAQDLLGKCAIRHTSAGRSTEFQEALI